MVNAVNPSLLSSMATVGSPRSSSSSLAVSAERLSAGLNVNSARSDEAGGMIDERLRRGVSNASTAMGAANSGIAMTETGESALGSINDILKRMREIALESAKKADSPVSKEDRMGLNLEFSQLQREIGRVAKDTSNSGQSILASKTPIEIRLDAGSDQVRTVSLGGIDLLDKATVTNSNQGALANVIDTDNTNILELGVAGRGTTFDTYGGGSKGALDAVAKIELAMSQVSDAQYRMSVGRVRIESAIASLVSTDDGASAKTRITNSALAMQTAQDARAQMIQQVGMAMIAQGNQSPQQVLSLLRS